MLFNKKIYYNDDEDFAFVQVTAENNGYFIWLYTNGNEISTSIIDYHLYDMYYMIEKAVDISHLPFNSIITLVTEPNRNLKKLLKNDKS